MADVPAAVIERLAPEDRTVLATDRGAPPMQIAALLEFDARCRPTADELTALLRTRLSRVPRLRQRLTRAPLGGGGPYWTDDPGFDPGRHLVRIGTVDPDDRRVALEHATNLLCRPLARNRPLWRAALLVDDEDRVGSLVLVLHHVLADGVAGLAALAALTDIGDDPRPAPTPFPRPGPCRADVVRDRLRDVAHRLATGPRRLARGVAGLTELGLLGQGPPRLAPRTSLTRPTGPDRTAAVVDLSLSEVIARARLVEGTVNDVLLTMVSGALLRILRERGESPPRLVVSVPVAGRAGSDPVVPGAGAVATGNHTGVRPVTIPAIVNDAARLRYLARLPRQHTPQRASSSAPLGIAFRAMARSGLFGWFIDHQRLVHTFASNLRGPAEHLSLGGHLITHLTALSATPGNVGVSFTALSYAGKLTLAVVTDPAICAPGPVADAAAQTFERLRPP